jgi:hypothetical protein
LLFTIVGSELLLAEAATNAMATSKMSPVKSHRLTVGSELVAALLIMGATSNVDWCEFRLYGKVGCVFGTTTLPKFAYKGEAELQFQEAFKESLMDQPRPKGPKQ